MLTIRKILPGLTQTSANDGTVCRIILQLLLVFGVLLSVAAEPAKPEQRADIRAEAERQASELRGLKFLKPVQYRLMDRADLRRFIIKKLREQYSSQEMRDYARSLAAMGLIPENTDLFETAIALYDEQVGAFYDPDEHVLYTFQDLSLGSSLDRMFLVHELTHALQDQHFNISKLPLKAKDNDDLVLATAALLEGDATLLMARWYIENNDPGNMLNDFGSMMRQDTKKLAAAPAFLRETLLFPYLHGQQFVMMLYGQGDTAVLDAAFRRPPTSTREILHPGEFRSDSTAPLPREGQLRLPPMELPGWRRIGNNVVGEFGIRILLSAQTDLFHSQSAAQGWRADRYHVYERGTNGPVAFVWMSAWDNLDEAGEFEETYRDWLKKIGSPRADRTRMERSGSQVTIRYSSEPSPAAR